MRILLASEVFHYIKQPAWHLPRWFSFLKIPERQTKKGHVLCPRMLCPDGSADSTEGVEGMEGAPPAKPVAGVTRPSL